MEKNKTVLRMSSDIISSLKLDKEFSTSRVIVAKEINGCDSSFIVSCVLGHCIKNKIAVLVVSMQNSLLHYQNVGLKMNYNLQKQIENGLLHFYNYGNEFINNLMLNKSNSLTTLLSNIDIKLSTITEKHGKMCVVFDGMSHLFDLQYKLTEVNMFCKKIIGSVRSYSGSFVLFHFNVEDDVTNVLSNLLSHIAHTVVEVESLSSGWSADVSGHVTIRHPGQKFEDEHKFTMDLKSSRYLFKLFDRGVKLFAPGTV